MGTMAVTRWLGRSGVIPPIVGGVFAVSLMGVAAATQLESTDDMAMLGAVVAVAAVSVVFVGLVVSYVVVAPLTRLQTRASAVEREVVEPTVPIDGPDLVTDLAETIETLAAERDAARRQCHRLECTHANKESWVDHVEGTVSEFTDVLARTSSGDLTQRMDESVRNEQLQSLAVAFNATMDDLERTIAELEAVAPHVTDSAEAVDDARTTVESATEQVGQSVQTIYEGTGRQYGTLTAATDELRTLSAAIQEIGSASNEVAELAAETATTGKQGRLAAESAIEEIEQLEAITDSVIEEIAHLDRAMATVEGLVENIIEVTKETNMVALNANLEAARADTAGTEDGFAPVTDEVKALATEARETAEEIEDRLERMRARTIHTGETVRESTTHASQKAVAVQETIDALEEIADLAAQTNDGVGEIATATRAQATSTQAAASKLDEASSVAEGVFRESQRVARVTTDQTEALASIAERTADLTARASHLDATLDGLETEVDALGPPPADAVTEADPSHPSPNDKSIPDEHSAADDSANRTVRTNQPVEDGTTNG